MARPTDYSEDTIEKSEQYLSECTDNKGLERIVKLPKVASLANYLGVSRKTLYNWGEIYPEFLHILEKLNQLQEERLIDEGLSGFYNPTIAKLVLGKHGYKDTSEITGADGKDLFSNDDKKQAEKAIKELTG